MVLYDSRIHYRIFCSFVMDSRVPLFRNMCLLQTKKLIPIWSIEVFQFRRLTSMIRSYVINIFVISLSHHLPKTKTFIFYSVTLTLFWPIKLLQTPSEFKLFSHILITSMFSYFLHLSQHKGSRDLYSKTRD